MVETGGYPMTAYVVNPPIRIDEQYYRDDEDIVQRALNGTRILAIGMRRSGKTSFLERVKRAATRENMAVVHCDVGMLSSGRDSSNRMRSLISAIERSTTDNTIILLDEVEGWNDVRRWPSQKLARVLNALNDSSLSLVMAAAPVFQPSECTQPNVIQRLVEPMQRHILGPLSETEARNLVSLSKTPGAC